MGYQRGTKRWLSGNAGRLEIVTYEPQASTVRGELLFVHGAWSSPWYWDTFFLPWFAERGFRCRALALRGHGGSDGKVRWASIRNYVDDVHIAAQDLRNPILIGHSMGGYIAQKYAARHNVRALALLASVPPSGAWHALFRVITERPLAFLRTIATLDLYGVVADPDTARALLFSRDENRTDKDHLLPYLKSESFRAFLDMLFLPVRKHVDAGLPVAVIGAEFDQIISQKNVAEAGRFHRVDPVMLPMASHMLTVDDRWQDAALHLERWIASDVLNESAATAQPICAKAQNLMRPVDDRRYPPNAQKRAKMLGQMQYHPLTLPTILDHAESGFADVPVWSREAPPALGETGPTHRQTWADTARRAKQVARVLQDNGLEEGDRVATLAWNTHRHLELYYGVTGIGAVLHTVNPRLSLDHLSYMLNFADDKMVFYDGTFSGLVSALKPLCPNVKHWIQLSNAPQDPAWSDTDYDTWIADAQPLQDWLQLDEHGAAALCFTSGTTGLPKGVLYSHRALVLETMAAVSPNALSLSRADTIAPIVPMFHVNAWSLPFAAAMSGASLALPGASLGGADLYDFFEKTGATISAGVPTIWQGLLSHTGETHARFSTMQRTIIGGSAVPEQMIRAFRDEYDVEVIHGWGMTETAPLGTTNALTPSEARAMNPAEAAQALKKQGRTPFGVSLKLTEEDGTPLLKDSRKAGHLQIQGHWVIDSYFGQTETAAAGGWFDTGDIATLGLDGTMTITDRDKDLIKSGGEWISSVLLEDIALQHARVSEAAAIAVPHPKWDERPLVVCVSSDGAKDFAEDVRALYHGLPSWQVPDVSFVDQLPVGATGKVLKGDLRASFREFHGQRQ